MKAYAVGFYSSEAWRKCREAYVKSRRGLCEQCLKRGIITPAELVHHKKPITPMNINDPNITLNWENLMAVCRDCHAELHRGRKRYKADALGHVAPLV